MSARLIALSVLFAAGCSGSGIAPVSGVVTLDGKPLAHATVVFEPAGDAKEPGPGSAGTTDAEGRYTLSVVTTNAPGAVVGRHAVRITAYEGDAEGESSAPTATDKVNRRLLVPVEYNAQTRLTFDVPAGGTTAANFDLRSAPDGAKKSK